MNLTDTVLMEIVGNRRVLIVDNEPANLNLLQEILANESCQISTATSGAEALKILSQHPVALVILDQDMPGMTGLETLKAIKKLYPDCDVMFVSAHTNPSMVSQALEHGADDYIRKPFSIIELISRVHVRFRIRDLRQDLLVANQKLENLSITDDLTGLLNMRSIYEKIDYEISRAARTGNNICCIMLDMDDFKNVNDSHDHLFGSFVIKEMGQILAMNLRDVDFAARYGGDEFLTVLIGIDEAGVQNFCNRLCEIVRTHTFREGNDEINLTLSIGYAVAGPGFKHDSRDLVRAADHALYISKEKGRNQVSGFGPQQTAIRINSFRKKAA